MCSLTKVAAIFGARNVMAYATYTTEALVCGTWSRNTADRSYLLFTRDAGMLYADARSVREERSRQRYALQDFSLVRVSLIKGKQSWKIGSIEIQKNYYHDAIDKEARGSVVNISRLLRRFVKGEEASPVLFDYVLEVLEVLQAEGTERSFVQMATQVQILSLLGYVDIKRIPDSLHNIAPASIAKEYSARNHKIIEKLYTHALTVSQL